MTLIEPGYLTGIYHPDGYFMANYHPEWGYPSVLRGVAYVDDQLSASATITQRGSTPSKSYLGSNPGISQLGSTPGITDTLNNEVSLQ